MLNVDAYNRLIAHIRDEGDEITAIAVQALLNRACESAGVEGNDTLVDHEEWTEARARFDNLRYAEIEFSNWSSKNTSDEDKAAEVKRAQAYLPSGWNATLVTKELVEGEFKRVIAITGYDNAGWTLEDYVIPRMNTGNLFPKEVTA